MGVESEFGTIKSHIAFCEESLRLEQKKFDHDIKQQAEKLTLEGQEDFYHCIAFQARDLYEFFSLSCKEMPYFYLHMAYSNDG